MLKKEVKDYFDRVLLKKDQPVSSAPCMRECNPVSKELLEEKLQDWTDEDLVRFYEYCTKPFDENDYHFVHINDKTKKSPEAIGAIKDIMYHEFNKERQVMQVYKFDCECGHEGICGYPWHPRDVTWYDIPEVLTGVRCSECNKYRDATIVEPAIFMIGEWWFTLEQVLKISEIAKERYVAVQEE